METPIGWYTYIPAADEKLGQMVSLSLAPRLRQTCRHSLRGTSTLNETKATEGLMAPEKYIGTWTWHRAYTTTGWFLMWMKLLNGTWNLLKLVK